MHTSTDRFRALAVTTALGLGIALAACAGGDESEQTTSSIAGSTTAPSTTVAPSTTAIPPTSTTTIPDPCDPATVMAAIGDAIAAARLDHSDAPWAADVVASTFFDRTFDEETFRQTMGLDCALMAAQRTAGGADRLLLAAWTPPRVVFVIQASDPPDPPYEEDVRVDLLKEAPWGEWVAPGVWAVTMEDGESLILGAFDRSLGALAKSWLVDWTLPPGDDVGETETERYAIQSIADAGGRNPVVAEPSNGNPVGSIVFVAPSGNEMIATVGPTEVFDALESYLTGPSTTVVIDLVEVRVTEAGPDQYMVGEAGFVCGAYGWRLELGFGTLTEATAFAAAVIDALDC